MTVTASSLTASSSTPADEISLWAPAAVLQTDWSEPLRVDTAWQTDVTSARSTAEQRRQRRQRPRLALRTPMPALDRADLLNATMVLSRASDARALVPLWVDQTKLTSAASNTDTVLNCDTTLRRLTIGARVLIIEPRRDTVAGTWEVATISSLTSTSITVSTGITNNYTTAARVVPLIEAEVGLTQEGRAGSGGTGRWTWLALERVGPMSLEATSTPGSNPSGFDTYSSLPIFSLPSADWASGLDLGLDRPGELTPLGLAEIPTVYGSRAGLRYSYEVAALTRTNAWAVKRFFDSRAGRCYAFWACTPLTYELDTVSSTTRIDVTQIGVGDDWTRRPYLFVVETDGTTWVREIDSVNRTGGVDQLTLTTAISPQLADADIRVLGMAIKARFESDAMSEEWLTDDQMMTVLPVAEVLDDKSVTISDLGDLTTSGLSSGCGEYNPELLPVPCSLPAGDPPSGMYEFYRLDSVYKIGAGNLWEDYNGSDGSSKSEEITDWQWNVSGGYWVGLSDHSGPFGFTWSQATDGRWFIVAPATNGLAGNEFRYLNIYSKTEIETAFSAGDWNLTPGSSLDDIADGACAWCLTLSIWREDAAQGRIGFMYIKLAGDTPAGTYQWFATHDEVYVSRPWYEAPQSTVTLEGSATT